MSDLDALGAPVVATMPLPPSVLADLFTWDAGAGVIGLELTGGPLLAVSLALFKQRDPEVFQVRDGLVVLAGVDRAGDPLELHFRAIGLCPAGSNPEASEGGYLLLERLQP